jgi:hypothetical protein
MATTVYLKNNWRWLVTSVAGEAKSNLDKLATNQSMQFVHDDMAQMTCDVPSDNPEIYRHANDGEPFVSYGRRLVYGFRRESPAGGNPWVPRLTGVMTINQDQATADEPVTHITVNDAWAWAKALPVLTPGGYLLPEKGYTYKNMRGDQIALDVIANAYTWITGRFLSGGVFPWGAADGGAKNLFINIADGTFEHTDTIPSFPIQQGATVYDVWQQLTQTGGLDIVLDPIYDPLGQPGVLSVMNVYAQAGSDQPNAVFGWDMFPRNLIGIDDLLDGTQIENWVQFYAGGLVAPHASSTASIHAYGPYFAQKNITQGDSATVNLLALAEIALRKRGKQTLTVDPTPELSPDPFTQYFLGDTVYPWAGRDLPPFSTPPPGLDGYGNALRHAVRSGQAPSPHRVYGFQIDLADNQVETVTNLLLTDPDASSI